MDKIKKIINSIKNKMKEVKEVKEVEEVEIYTYHFPDGKIYVGFTSFGLEKRHNQHIRHSISPIYKYLNNEETYQEPKYEKTVIVDKDIDSYEIYPHLREILDKYTSDTSLILNKNLWLYGY